MARNIFTIDNFQTMQKRKDEDAGMMNSHRRRAKRVFIKNGGSSRASASCGALEKAVS